MASKPPKKPGLLARLRAGRATVDGEAGTARFGGGELESRPESRFDDQGEVARGGMGSIRKVFDKNLLRNVAMKVLDARHTDARRQRMFREEAQITSQLEHPNIVPVHDFAVDEDGTPFMTMKLVRGDTIEALVQREPEGPRSPERLRFYLEAMLRVCDALAFAHSRGVLHRDLKPANIMVGEAGQVYLMDWGLASVRGARTTVDEDVTRVKIADKRAHETQDGIVIGTLEYLSPEQAFGKLDALDERTDVFGLGAVLYFIVTGRHLYEGEMPIVKIMAARAGRFVPVEDIVQGPARLVSAIQRALASDREARFQTVSDLAEELRAILRGGLHFGTRSYEVGDVICREGDEGHEAFVLMEGSCSVYRGAAGQRQPLAILLEGDVFGEAAVFAEERRTATVEATSHVRVLVVTREALLSELGVDRWSGAFVQALAKRFVELSQRRGP